jgi:N-acetylglucosamine-6-phosphate deacetylase
MLAITNAKFYQDDVLIEGKNVLIQEGKISSITDQVPENAEVINANGNYLAPGFIDLQIYGAGGKLFSAEPSVESLEIIENDLLKKGTTGFLACMATNTPEVFNACIKAAKEHRSIAKNCLGLHLEGPFLNPKRLGAHVPAFVRKANLDEIKTLLEFGDGIIKMMTIAPELQDDDVIQYLLDQGVIVSLGHSNATFDEATAAYNKGIQTTTHLFNAMSPIHHREPGIPTAVFNHDKAMASIIVDGQHLSFEVVKFAQKLLKEKAFLITDAVTECSTGPYQHQLTGDKYIMPDGTLSGSSLTMPKAVQNCVSHCDILLPDALKMGSLYPSKLIAQDHIKGKIETGYQADLVILDQHLNLEKVIHQGNCLSN